MTNPWLFSEALASVALSHPEDHDCRTCRAARGDHDAWIEMYALVDTDAKRAEREYRLLHGPGIDSR